MYTWQTLRDHSEKKAQYLVREKVIDSIRLFFKQQDFHEVETPLLVPTPSTEPFLEFFKTDVHFQDGQTCIGFLTSSPEFAMKKLLAGGLGNIFQICKSFRSHEGRSPRHNPEFTILEWYRTNADYTNIMTDFEQMMLAILRTVTGNSATTTLQYQGKSYDLSAPWERISVAEAFAKWVGVDDVTLLDEQKLVAVAKQKGYSVNEHTTWEQAYNQLLLNEIEPHLGATRPTILYDYPASQAALSRKKQSDPRFAERFEVYLAGYELGNAFTELVDAKEQKARCIQDLADRVTLGKQPFPLDDSFIAALESGMPRTGGIAVGVDRLCMLFADVQSIHDTMFFPVDELFPPIA